MKDWELKMFAQNEQISKELLKEINNVPALWELNSEQLSEIAKLVIVDRYKHTLDKQAVLSFYNYDELKEQFINSYSSIHTQKTYRHGLALYDNWCNKVKRINKLEVTQQQIDEYINSLKSQNLSNNSICIAVKAVSAFYSFAERYSNGVIRNTVKGTRQAPKAIAKNNDKFYTYGVDENTLARTKKDIETIINHIDNIELKTIIYIAVATGCRVGAFSSMNIHGNKYRCWSKGATINGVLSDNIIQYIDKHNITHNTPFKRYTETRLSNLFKYHTKKLHKQGLISYAYSFHDLRHYFALSHYIVNKDIYQLKQLLQHNSVVITERYLKGLNVIQ